MINIFYWSLFCILNNNNFTIKKATILVTNKCNFKCEHCFWGNISKGEVIADNLLKYVVSKCMENNIKHICFSGGEPFLYLDKIVDVMRCYKNEFAKVSICTNGYWGDDACVIDKLKVAGINSIELSYDKYHAKFISFDKIINIINEVKINDIKIEIVVSVANFKEIIQFQSKLTKYIDAKHITYQYVGRYGNGENIEIGDYANFSAKCSQFMKQICVDFNGLLYYCCGPYVSLGTNSNFCVGQFTQDSIDNLKNNQDLYHYMSEITYSDGCYACEECLKMLDDYIFIQGNM